jgi:two-component system, cell cycle sensor histidine kinase and response regulator CckA
VLSYLHSRVAELRNSASAAIERGALRRRRAITQEERIAIVDDEEVMTSVTAALLQRLGYPTVSYNSPARFMKAFEAAPARIDLVVTDVVMPGITGIQIVRMLREAGYDVPILLMTGYGVQPRPQPGNAMGRISFIRKPFTAEHLAQSVRRLLTQDR